MSSALLTLSTRPRMLAALRSLAPARAPRPQRVIYMAATQNITDQGRASSIAAAVRRVAVVGIRPMIDRLATRPAAFVPAALHADGVAIIPIPTMSTPEADAYFGAAPLASLADLARVPPVDCVVFFRKPAELPPADQVLAALRANGGSGAPPVAWLQSGIRAPAWEADLLAGGVPVVADRCIKVERARGRGSGGLAGRL